MPPNKKWLSECFAAINGEKNGNIFEQCENLKEKITGMINSALSMPRWTLRQFFDLCQSAYISEYLTTSNNQININSHNPYLCIADVQAIQFTFEACYENKFLLLQQKAIDLGVTESSSPIVFLELITNVEKDFLICSRQDTYKKMGGNLVKNSLSPETVRKIFATPICLLITPKFAQSIRFHYYELSP